MTCQIFFGLQYLPVIIWNLTNKNFCVAEKIKITLLQHINNKLTSWPIWQLPVKDNSFILSSAAIAFPISAPPQHKAATAPGKLFLSRTSATILVVATDTKGVVSDPFQSTVFPHT